MKKITLCFLLLFLSVLSFAQTVSVTVTELKVRNLDATTINFGTNVSSVNVSITTSVTTSYNPDPSAVGKLGVYYKRNSSTSTTPIIPTNGFDGNFKMLNGRTETKTFKITLNRSEFDNSGGYVYVQYDPPGGNLLNYKSTNIIVTKLEDPISNNAISGNQMINEGQSASTLSGSLPVGGNGAYTYMWQQKVVNGTWTTISGANNVNYSPIGLTATTSYRRIVTSSGTSNSISNEVTITVIPAPTLQNNAISLNGNTVSGSLPIGGLGIYQYVWMLDGGEEIYVFPEGGQNLELPSWIHNDLYEALNVNYGLFITRYVTSGIQTMASNSVRIPLLQSNKITSKRAKISDDLSAGELMTVYPTLASESINFSTYFSTDKEIEIVLYSENLGNEKSVFKGKVIPNQVVNWNIPPNYQKGIYFYKILSDNKEVKTGKVIFK